MNLLNPHRFRDDALSFKNLIASWEFEGNLDDYKGVHDASVGGGTPTFGINGVVNNDIILDRSQGDYLTVPDHSNFTFNSGGQDSEFTIMFWLKVATVHATIHRWIICKRGSNINCEWEITHTSTHIRVRLFGHSWGTVYIEKSFAVSKLTAGWHHCVITYDGSETAAGIELTYDKTLTSGTTGSAGSYTGMSNYTADIEIGADGDGGEFLDGELDEIKIYNTKMNTADIEYIYDEELLGNSVLP